jgi:hypothetical protein
MNCCSALGEGSWESLHEERPIERVGADDPGQCRQGTEVAPGKQIGKRDQDVLLLGWLYHPPN